MCVSAFLKVSDPFNSTALEVALIYRAFHERGHLSKYEIRGQRLNALLCRLQPHPFSENSMKKNWNLLRVLIFQTSLFLLTLNVRFHIEGRLHFGKNKVARFNSNLKRRV